VPTPAKRDEDQPEDEEIKHSLPSTKEIKRMCSKPES
jgi:ribosome-binding factor A